MTRDITDDDSFPNEGVIVNKATKTIMKYLGATAALALVGCACAFYGGDKLPYRLGTFQGGCVFAACLVSAFTDLRTHKILNLVTYPLFLLLLLVQLTSCWFPEDLATKLGYVAPYGKGVLDALLGFAVCFAMHFVAFVLSNGHGSGDAKLAAGIGMGLGLQDGIVAMGATYICAFVFALIEMLGKRFVRAIMEKKSEVQNRSDGDDEKKEKKQGFSLSYGMWWVGNSVATTVKANRKTPIYMGVGFFVGTGGAILGYWLRMLNSLI